MKLIASGEACSAAMIRSPSFSRSASSTTITILPFCKSAITESIEFNHFFIKQRQNYRAAAQLPARMEVSKYPSRYLEVGCFLHRHRDRLVNQHHRNVLANGINIFAVGANQSTVDFFLHRLAAT